MSACSASRLRAVSFRVSPLVRLEVEAEILMTSALSRKAASSNEMRVRVLGSTKKLTRVLPRRAGTFLIWRVPICLNAADGVQERGDLGGAQFLDAEKVFAPPAVHGFDGFEIQTESTSSPCLRRT